MTLECTKGRPEHHKENHNNAEKEIAFTKPNNIQKGDTRIKQNRRTKRPQTESATVTLGHPWMDSVLCAKKSKF